MSADLSLGTIVPRNYLSALQERWEREWVAAILDAENAEQEAVADQHETTPGQNSNRLDFGIGKTGDLVCQGNSGESKKSI